MKKTQLTIALLGSLVATASFAGTTGAEVNTAITNYSKTSIENAKTSDDSIVYRSSTLVDNIMNDKNVQGHLVNSFIADKTAGLKTKAEKYKEFAIEKKERKKDKYAEKKQAARDAKGWSKVKAFKEEISAKVELEKQRGRVKAAEKSLNELDKYDNDGFYKTQLELANGIKNDTVKGSKEYNETLLKPSIAVLGDAWSAAKSFNYVGYTTNIHKFWDSRIAVWNGTADISKETGAFNELTNYATIEAVAKVNNTDVTQAIKEYSNANELAYTVTTLGNSENQIFNLVNGSTNLNTYCAINATKIASNEAVQKAVETIAKLQDKEEIADVFEDVFNVIGIDNEYVIANLKDSIGQMGATVIATIVGDTGSFRVDDKFNFIVDITDVIAEPVADAIANNSIYKEVNESKDLIVGNQVCDYNAVSTSKTKVAQAMMTAVNYYSNTIAKESGNPVDEATKQKVLLALEGTIYQNINNIK
ncbi:MULTISPECIES: hypothetical protein [Francisella]|uniref:Uncharacterized protein n=1 Tax=Francisella adeliensis TaxID=2007306 RepID=A0A2Z4XW50_9GAMM|nr:MULTISPECIES: hypothetical protein [Francisella]AXA32910.1 hypothetical protein CDH04_00065 [Francisella adeliensis]MBK2086409.1 hypothetical protein [Francisella adeliensis]MBK2096624.1 hypothetical protein [Francisella adeliensis]QIW11136.1 hypothetical protein FZC43_00065 [Francisella adeliensis]QIW13013.1 hypothetical protein FZC44_00065 [Francisella adeliensis]